MATITLHVAADHPAFEGHFPGQPLLPGVALLAEVIEAVRDDAELALRVGPRPRIGIAKFVAPVLPGAQLQLSLHLHGARLHFELRQGDRLSASGHFEPADDAGAEVAPR